MEEMWTVLTFAAAAEASGFFCSDLIAVETVSRVAMQAFRFTSIPNVRISCRPKICCDCAAAKAKTTPEPVPTSTTSGTGLDVEFDEESVDFLKRSDSHCDSDAEDSVSKKRYESSAGS